MKILLSILIFLNASFLAAQEIKTIKGKEFIVDTIFSNQSSYTIKYTSFDTTFMRVSLEFLIQEEEIKKNELDYTFEQLEVIKAELKTIRKKIKRLQAVIEEKTFNSLEFKDKDSPW